MPRLLRRHEIGDWVQSELGQLLTVELSLTAGRAEVSFREGKKRVLFWLLLCGGLNGAKACAHTSIVPAKPRLLMAVAEFQANVAFPLQARPVNSLQPGIR